MPRSLRGFVLAFAAGLAACSGGGNEHTVSTREVGLQCVSGPSTCSITSAACQREVLAITACVRGDSAPPLPKVRMITADELRVELRGQVDAMAMDASPWDPALAALHLLPAGMSSIDAAIDNAVQSIAAYYDDETKDITVISSTVPSDPVDGMYALSHELTHYLQDRAEDLAMLKDRFEHDTDSSVSVHSLIEGEAVATSTRVLLQLLHKTPEELDWNGFFDRLQSSLLDDIASSDAPLESASMNLPYTVGGKYVSRVWNAYDRKHVEALFEQPPLSLVDWVLPGSLEHVTPTLVEPLDCAPPLAPNGFSVADIDSFGAAGALALLSAAGGTLDLALASSLRGDSIAVYTPNDASGARGVTAWRLRFSDESAVSNFSNGVRPLGLTIRAFGRELLITASGNPAQNPLQGPALDACPKPDQLEPTKPASGAMAALKQLLHTQ